MNGFRKLNIISGNSNEKLAKYISKKLKVKMIDAEIGKFSDGEIAVKINESIRGGDVFIIQSLSTPVNDNLMELLIIIDALRRASADRITAVIPYYGYARQDRKDKSRVPITAKLLANLIEAAGADRVMTMDLHASQIQGFFDIPVDHLFGLPIITNYIKKNIDTSNMIVVSPDIGSAKKSRYLAKVLNLPFAIIDKRRSKSNGSKDNESEILNVIGDVKGKNIIIIDDMIDTAGTIVNATRALKELQAKKIYIACTHSILSGPAIERLKGEDIEKIIITDTIVLPKEKILENMVILSVGSQLAKAIDIVHNNESISPLFDKYEAE